MIQQHISWPLIFWGVVNFLKIFGIIPGTVAAYFIQKIYQARRQRKALEGWPTTEATIFSATVSREGRRNVVAEITYSYFVDEYRSGTYLRYFPSEDSANEFIREVKGKQVLVHYETANPDHSVILDVDLDMMASLVPQRGF
ncbi:DUF3592 domain-containing protein [Terracidiphilus gabretensis]|uniref:DUF3592 domain-containing protein n=1 Tax=Terracidiphilus gabretensis TaxID=1577687 RepID=UPI00071B72C3|nr:DUF3592 domain-containing protein [Terracidiphilus gabretensis]